MNASIEPQTGLPLAPFPSDGPPPSRRIASAASAQQLVALLWQANESRSLRNAAIQGQLDGNPPYSPTKMRAAGRAGDPNFNTLEASALLDTALVPYHDLFSGDRHYTRIITNMGEGEDKVTMSRIISEEVDRTLSRWKNFDFQMQQMQRDFVAFGRGYLAWDNEASWRFRKVAQHRVMVPDSSEIDLDRFEGPLVILHKWPVSALWSMVRDKAHAREVGWNVNEVMKAIALAIPTDPATPMDPIGVQQQLKDNDLYVSAKSSTVQTATIYMKEFSGKWSEYMVMRERAENAKETPGWLLECPDKYDSLMEVITPFFLRVLDGSWNGTTGLGRDIFVPMQLKDRLACSQANAAFLRSSLVLQPSQALDKSRLNLLQVGSVTWVPEGVNVLQSSILGDIESTIVVSRELSNTIERNTGIYRPSIERQTKGNPATLGEFEIRSASAAALSSSTINWFYSQLDRLYEQLVTRLVKAGLSGGENQEWSKEAKLFVERCEEKGVPRAALKDLESVKAWRTIGNGSAITRQQTLNGFLSLYPMLPEDGRVNLLEDIVGASGSQAQVERYVRTSDQEDLPSDQLDWALLENAAMKIGAPITWTPTQNNLIHASTHLQAGSAAMASIEQGANPVEVLAFVDAIGAHTAIHLQKEAANPMSKQALNQLEQQWSDLAKLADQLRKMLEAQQQEQQGMQQQQQRQVTESDLKQQQVMADVETSRMKASELIKLKKERQDADIALKAQKQMADLQIKAYGESAKANQPSK
jgi:hypothetical protein